LQDREGDRYAAQQPLQEAGAVRPRQGRARGGGRAGGGAGLNRTLNDLFLDSVTRFSKPDAVVHWAPSGPRGLDSRSLLPAVSRLCLALRSMGLERGARVAILSENRPEWLISDYALLGAGAVGVPIYTSLTPAQIEYILSNSGAWAVIVSTPELLKKV